MVSGEELLRFPTEYPIKVVGRPSDEFRTRVHAIMLRHAPSLDIDRISERLSSGGRFLSISYLIEAQSREHVIALVEELKACEGVLTII